MIELDGSTGGGGFVRTALALSAITGESVRIEGIRGARPDPGLEPQHLAAVRAIAAICDGTVEGAEIDARTLAFTPDRPRGGEYDVDIGTAGSVTLLFDTVLPLALAIDEPLRVTARGGTDVKWAPPVEYYRRVKLPLLRRRGLQAALDLDRSGFYPAGGGEATLCLAPSTLQPLEFAERGSPTGARIYSKASADLADADVAERQAIAAADGIEAAGVTPIERTTTYAATASTGSSVVLRVDFENTVVGFDALGERGTPSEAVAAGVVEAATAFLDGGAAVDRHLADQLLAFLALSGGRVRVPTITEHVGTALDLLEAFGYDVDVDRDDGECTAVLVGP